MRKRALYPLLAGLLALCLTACGPVSEKPSPSPSPTAPPEASAPVSAEPVTPTEEPSHPSDTSEPVPGPVLESSLPDREYEPWQEGYMEFLSELTAREWKDIQAYEALSDEEKQTEAGKALDRPWDRSDSYSLYDVDEDGEPELFVLFGNCEVAYVMRCYTFRDGEVALAGEFNFWHSTLYTYPGRNAVLQWQGHWDPVEYTLEDGRLKKVGSIHLEADDMWEWEKTDLGEVVPGAAIIMSYRTRADNSTGAALLLPICNYYEDVPEQSKTPPEEARAAILEAVSGERPLRSVCAYSYGDGNTEWMTWEEYIRNDIFGPFQIQAHAWADLDGDGREECALRLWADSEQDVDACAENLTILSERDGTVYAYCLEPFGRYELTAEGLLYDYELQALSFYKEQCYLCWSFGQVPPGQYIPVKWLDGSPAD